MSAMESILHLLAIAVISVAGYYIGEALWHSSFCAPWREDEEEEKDDK